MQSWGYRGRQRSSRRRQLTTRGARQTHGTAPSTPHGPVCRRSRTGAAIPRAAPGYTRPVVRCTTCGEQNSDTARFCQNCGSPLVRAAPAPEERKVVSILFVDLVEFTSRSDQADPEDVRAMLLPYHTRVKSEIESFGGTVEKFIGDAVMAVFGAPVAHGDDAERAVRAGLRVLEAIEELDREHPELDLTVRAAVDTGEAIVDARSQPDTSEGLAHGDVVNTASRMQTGALPGTLIVGEETYRATRTVIEYRPIEPVVAKGKREPLAAWQATGTLTGPAERTVPPLRRGQRLPGLRPAGEAGRGHLPIRPTRRSPSKADGRRG